MQSAKSSTLIGLLLLSCSANTQPLNEKLKVNLDSLDKNYPEEKIFIHTDKTNYTSEQTIWFKAYTT